MYQILSLHFTHTQSICIKSIYICLVVSTIEAFAVALVLVEWSSINCFMSKLYLHFLSKQTGLNASMVEISAELGLIVWKFREILFIWLFVKLFVSRKWGKWNYSLDFISSIETIGVALVLVEWRFVNCFLSDLDSHFLSK